MFYLRKMKSKMKKPSKEQIQISSLTYLKKNRERIRKRRNVVNPEKRNSSEVKEAQEKHAKRKELFYKSFFGLELIKQKISR